MTVQDFVKLYKDKNPDGTFFDKRTLGMYGESMDNMRVNGKGVVNGTICYELVARRDGLLGWCDHFYYFDEDTMQIVHHADTGQAVG